MCSLYFRHDIMASHDLKIRKIKACYGLEGFGIYWAILETLAEISTVEGGDTSMHLDSFLLAGLIGTKRWRIVDSIIRDFGLFEIEVRKDDREYFYSRRLRRDFHEGVILRGGAAQRPDMHEVDEDPEETAPPRVKTKRELTPEARKAMSEGGRKGKARLRPENKVDGKVEPSKNKVEPSENKVDGKVEPSKSKVEPSENKVDGKVEPSKNKVEPSENKVDGKVEPSKNKVEPSENKVDGKVEPSKSKVSGGDNRGGKAPKTRRQEDISLPQPPQGGFESVRAEIDKIEDEWLRRTVDSMLFPDTAYKAYGLAFQKIYNEVTGDDPSFAKSAKLPYGVIGHAKEVFWLLMPKREDGSTGRPSVGDVIGALGQVREVFQKAKASSFIRSKPAMANLSWLIEPNNFVKVSEGVYRDAPSSSPTNTTPPPAARGYSNAMWKREERSEVVLSPDLQAIYERHQEEVKQRQHANDRRAEESEGGAG